MQRAYDEFREILERRVEVFLERIDVRAKENPEGYKHVDGRDLIRWFNLI